MPFLSRSSSQSPPLFGEEGDRRLAGREDDLFPASVRPPFLRLLWIALLAQAVAAAVLLAALSGRLA